LPVHIKINNQIENREAINNCNNYTEIHTLLKKFYPEIYSLTAMDNLPVIKDHLLSVTISDDKTGLVLGESFIAGYYKSVFNIALYEKEFILCLIYYFIPGIFDEPLKKKLEDRDPIIKECMTIIIESINQCSLLLDNENDFDCSLYGIVLCIIMTNTDWIYKSASGGHIHTEIYKSNQSRIVINNKSIEHIKVIGIHGSILKHKNFGQIHDIMFNTSQKILCLLQSKLLNPHI
jgi:hypothetical protein